MEKEKAEKISELLAEIRSISDSINYAKDNPIPIGSYYAKRESKLHADILDLMEVKKRELGDKLESI